MGWLEKRQDPIRDVPAETKESQLQAFVDWLGVDWLNETTPHPVRELWHRRDWLATTELLTIGSALQKIKADNNHKTLRDAADDVRADDFGNRAGSLFEILGAAMFQSKRHAVTLPKVGQPGFDFVIHLPNSKQLRVSCKALVSSAKEIEFRRFAKSLHSDFTKVLGPGTACVTKMFLLGAAEPKKFDKAHILHHLKLAGKQGFTLADKAYSISGWAFRLDRLDPEPGYKFWRGAVSQTFLAMCPFLGDEQKRFEDKIQNAVSNLKKHCADVSDDVGNAIFIKVPESVSFAKAREWLKASLDAESECVSSVLLIRTQVIAEGIKKSTSCVMYEFSYVENPNAKYPLKTYLGKDFQLEVEVPIGRTSDTEARLEVHSGATMINPTESYVYFSGHHFYHMDLADSGNTFTARQYPNISITAVVTGLAGDQNLEMNFIYPPENELVLI